MFRMFLGCHPFYFFFLCSSFDRSIIIRNARVPVVVIHVERKRATTNRSRSIKFLKKFFIFAFFFHYCFVVLFKWIWVFFFSRDHPSKTSTSSTSFLLLSKLFKCLFLFSILYLHQALGDLFSLSLFFFSSSSPSYLPTY